MSRIRRGLDGGKGVHIENQKVLKFIIDSNTLALLGDLPLPTLLILSPNSYTFPPKSHNHFVGSRMNGVWLAV